MADTRQIDALAERIRARLGARPALFYELLVEFADVEYRDLLLAWGRLRERVPLERDEHGRYLLSDGQKAPTVVDGGAATVDTM